MLFDEKLLRNLAMPPFFITEQVKNWTQIPVEVISSDPGIYCAYYKRYDSLVNSAGQPVFYDHVTAGMADDPVSARFYCFMEMVERSSATSGHTIRSAIFQGSRGGKDIHWSRFVPYHQGKIDSVRVARQGISPFKVLGSGLVSGDKYQLPAEFVFPWWNLFHSYPGPSLETEGVGTAAGFPEEKEPIIRRAIFELLERDALMLSWRVPGWPVTALPAGKIPQDLGAWLERENLVMELFEVGDPQLVSVVMAMLFSAEGNDVTIGSCAGKAEAENIRKAAMEAIMLRGSAQILDAQTPEFTDAEINDSEKHVLYAWRNGQTVTEWYRLQAQRNTSSHAFHEPDQLEALFEKCAQVFGHEPVLVPLTDPGLAELGYQVVRVMLPGTYKKEYSHSNPFLGGRRLEKLGVKPAALNRRPHPIG